MDALTFISSIIESLSWPAAIVLLACLLRKPLSALLPNLKRVKYRGVELDFRDELQKLEGQAKTAGLQIAQEPQERDTGPRRSEDSIAEAARLATDFPEPAVGVAWIAVEQELTNAVVRMDISPDIRPSKVAAKNITLLREHGCIDADTGDVLDRMRRLRNAAVHPKTYVERLSADEAREFVRLAQALSDRLKAIRP